jgi:hypothetical protein
MTSDVKMQNLVNEVTDALLAGENLDTVRRKHDVARGDADDLINLIERINQSMQKVEPSAQFAKSLKADLMGEQRTGVVGQIRKLPARVQYAAVVAIVGGFLLILRRMFFGEEHVVQEDTNPAQEKI